MKEKIFILFFMMIMCMSVVSAVAYNTLSLNNVSFNTIAQETQNAVVSSSGRCVAFIDADATTDVVIYYSIDYGSTFFLINISDVPQNYDPSLSMSDDCQYIIFSSNAHENNVYASSDYGRTFTDTGTSITAGDTACNKDCSIIYATNEDDGWIYYSTDYATSWTIVENITLFDFDFVNAFIDTDYEGTIIIASIPKGTTGGTSNVHISYDSGNSFYAVNTTDSIGSHYGFAECYNDCQQITVSDSYDTGESVLFSDDYGMTWRNISLGGYVWDVGFITPDLLLYETSYSGYSSMVYWNITNNNTVSDNINYPDMVWHFGSGGGGLDNSDGMNATIGFGMQNNTGGNEGWFEVKTVNIPLLCIPSWVCIGYDTCVYPALNVSCNMVYDNNFCNETYTGNYTEFPVQNCTYTPTSTQEDDAVRVSGQLVNLIPLMFVIFILLGVGVGLLGYFGVFKDSNIWFYVGMFAVIGVLLIILVLAFSVL